MNKTSLISFALTFDLPQQSLANIVIDSSYQLSPQDVKVEEWAGVTRKLPVPITFTQFQTVQNASCDTSVDDVLSKCFKIRIEPSKAIEGAKIPYKILTPPT